MRSVLGVLVFVTACGGGGTDDYGAEHREDFVADCAFGEISRRTCGCFYDRLAEEVPFERFETLDEELRRQRRDIPADVATLVAGCAAENQGDDGG